VDRANLLIKKQTFEWLMRWLTPFSLVCAAAAMVPPTGLKLFRPSLVANEILFVPMAGAPMEVTQQQ
jgi:hypothetical protein